MSSTSIYRDYSVLQKLLLQHSNISVALVSAYYKHRSGNPAVVNKHFRQLLESIGFDYHKQGHSPKEITYRIQHDDWGRHYCVMCGNEVRQFHSVETGFARHCCAKCSGKNPETLAVRKQTCMELFGVENASFSEMARESTRRTCQEKYGVDAYQQTAEFAEKMSAAAAKRTTEARKQITEKRKATNVEKFGVDFPLQSAEKYQQLKDTCLEKYGVDNPQKNEVVRKKTEDTCVERYGVPCSLLNDAIRTKGYATLMKNYGVTNPGQSPVIQERMKSTNLERYGVEYPLLSQVVLAKIQYTLMQNYSVTNPGQSPVIQERMRITNNLRYGVDYYSQSVMWQGVAYNNSNKEFVFLSGNKYNVQGYEPYAINRLLSEGYTEEEIQLTNRPTVKYFWASKDGYGDDNWHYYHPDIIIPKENRIIEVKSTWTYNGAGPACLSKNLAKKEACIAAGFVFDFWIF